MTRLLWRALVTEMGEGTKRTRRTGKEWGSWGEGTGREAGEEGGK